MKSLLQRVFALSLCVAPAIYGHCGLKYADSSICPGAKKVIGCDGNDATITIPATISVGDSTYNVVEIGNQAFKSNKNITSVTLGHNIKTISQEAFKDCHNLKIINFNDSLHSIADFAFYSCRSLREIKFPQSLRRIDPHAFAGCELLTSIELPNSYDPKDQMMMYSNSLFFGTNIQTIKCPSSNPNFYYLFPNTTTVSNWKDIKLLVPAGSKAAYEKSDWWGRFTIEEQGARRTSISQDNVIESTSINSAETKSVTIPLMPGYAVTKSAAGITKHIM